MIYDMKLNDAPFQAMKAGEKTVELRLYDEKRSLLDIGDFIIFTDSADGSRIAVMVTALYRYGNFEALFEEIVPDRCGFPKCMTGEEAADSMRAIYPQEKEARFGVLGIRVALQDLQEVLSLRQQLPEGEGERLFPTE